MSSSNEDTKTEHKILEGKILLYKHTHLKTPWDERAWQFRYLNPFGEGYIRRSTRTDSLSMAKHIAIEHYEDAITKRKLGLDETGVTIDLLWDRFNTKLGQKPATKRSWQLVWNRVRPWWKDKDLSTIKDDAIIDYLDARNEDWNTSPHRRENGWAAKTIEQELNLLKFLFNRAMKNRLTIRMPEFPSMRKIERRNYSNIFFQEPKDYRVIWNQEQQDAISKWQSKFRSDWKRRIEWEQELGWTKLGEKITSRGVGKPANIPHFGTGGKRFAMIRHYVIIFIAKNCWARPQEIKVCQFKDFRLIDNDQFVVLDISRQKSKTNKSREAVFINTNKMWFVLQDWKYEWKRHYGREPTEHDLLFPMTTDPEAVNTHLSMSFRHNMKTLDKELGLIVSKARSNDGVEKGVTMYSLRKMGITNALKHNHFTPSIVARLAGHSEEVLANYYNVNLNSQYRYLVTKHIRELEDAKARRGRDD